MIWQGTRQQTLQEIKWLDIRHDERTQDSMTGIDNVAGDKPTGRHTNQHDRIEDLMAEHKK